MASETTFTIDGDKLIRCVPVPQLGEHFSKCDVVIDKETFIKCYNAWIKEGVKDENCQVSM